MEPKNRSGGEGSKKEGSPSLHALIGAVEGHGYASQEQKRHQILRDEAWNRKWQGQGAMAAGEVENYCGEKCPQKTASNIRTALGSSFARSRRRDGGRDSFAAVGAADQRRADCFSAKRTDTFLHGLSPIRDARLVSSIGGP
jgi:hypothetical protein